MKKGPMLAKQMSLGPTGTFYQNNLVGEMMENHWVGKVIII